MYASKYKSIHCTISCIPAINIGQDAKVERNVEKVKNAKCFCRFSLLFFLAKIQQKMFQVVFYRVTATAVSFIAKYA